jgi:hypothetical protein
LDSIAATIKRSNKRTITKAALIKIGDNTHHQLQLITWHNLSAMKRIVRAPVNPMPPEEEDDDLDVIVWFVSTNEL